MSNYARGRAVCPDYGEPDFLAWLREYVKDHHIRAIVPSEGLLLALRPVFAEFAGLLPSSQQEQTLYAGLGKCDVFLAFRKSGSQDGSDGHLPPSLLVDVAGPLPERSDLERLGSPLYVKVDGSSASGVKSSAVYKMPSADAALDKLLALLPDYSRVLVQGHVPGHGVGVFFLSWNGQILAEFMHLRVHEVPHTGGVSSLRRSWWHPAIRNDALVKVRRLGWEGVAMMEYRWDPATDQFHFIEMNGRFWGSLHLALYAGVDFPRLLLDAFHGYTPEPVSSFPLAIWCRWTFPKEVQYVWSRLKDRQLSLPSRVWSVIEFGLLALDFRVYSDLLFPGDRKLYWESIKRFAKTAS